LAAVTGIADKGSLRAVLACNLLENPDVSLFVHGIEKATGDLIIWDLPAAKLGDEVAIRILGPGTCHDGDRIGGLPGDG
jgi:hypothetical protein